MKLIILLVLLTGTSAVCAQWKGWGKLTAYPVQKNMHLLHTKDITGDGIPDITALPTASEDFFSVLKGNGNGSFSREKTFTRQVNYMPGDIADLNKDGYPELVISSYWDNGFRVYNGNPANNFIQSTYYATGMHNRALKCTDINKDGLTDIVTVTSGSWRTIHLHVFINTGNGSFKEKQTFASVLDTSKDLFIIDKNNDGLPDIAVSSSFAWVLFFMQTPDGNFEPRYWPTNSMAQVTFGDADKDGKEDLFLLYTSFDNNPGSDSLVIQRNTGGSSFASSIVVPQLAQYHVRSTIIRLADINNDGYKDIFVNHCDPEGNITDTLYYLLATGPFSFGAPVAIQLPAPLLTMELADLNADGYADLVVSTNNKTIYVALGNKTENNTDQSPDIRTYPNPAHTSLHIDGLSGSRCTISVFDSKGVLCFSQTTTAATVAVPVQQYAAGIYFIRIADSNKKGITRQVIVN